MLLIIIIMIIIIVFVIVAVIVIVVIYFCRGQGEEQCVTFWPCRAVGAAPQQKWTSQ